MLNSILLSLVAGVVGTGIGGVLGSFFGKRSELFLCMVLSFAAGIMVGIVTFSLIPEAIMLSNILTCILGIVTGVFVIMTINHLASRILSRACHTRSPSQLCGDNARSQPLYRAGLIIFCAIALHNLPEGIAIGSSGVHNPGLSIGISALLMLHNIPEGMAISAPLVGGGVGRGAATFLGALSGSATVLGAILGYWFGGINMFATAFCISTASGAMLYVVFGELIPQSLAIQKNRLPSFVLIFGIICGLFFASFIK